MLSSRLLVLGLLVAFGKEVSGGVMDNFNDGLKLAGQMFGINTAADVANLVAKAFSGATKQRKPDIMSVLQQGFQGQGDQSQEAEPESEQSQQGSEPENAQETPPVEQKIPIPSRQGPAALGEFNTGQMLTNMLRMVGFDARKLGALAINALVMIAQAIGNTLMQATQTGGTLFNQPQTNSGPEALYENSEHQPRELRSGTPIDWFLQRPNQQTQKVLSQIMNRELPEHIVDMIEERENSGAGNAACLKLLMCKSSPIIWGMQESLQTRLNDKISQQNIEESSDPKEDSTEFNSGAFFKYLPSLAEFRIHGADCESRFASHCSRNHTQG